MVRSPPEKLLTRSAYLCSVQIFNPLSSSAVLAALPSHLSHRLFTNSPFPGKRPILSLLACRTSVLCLNCSDDTRSDLVSLMMVWVGDGVGAACGCWHRMLKSPSSWVASWGLWHCYILNNAWVVTPLNLPYPYN